MAAQAPTLPWWFRTAARIRGVTILPGILAIVAGVLSSFLLPEGTASSAVALLGGLGGFAAIALGMAATFTPVVPDLPARTIDLPVSGRWCALNSPASNVPSHGTHGHGQTFAIDLVYDPGDGSRPAFGSRGFRPPEEFPGYGRPVYAPADGRVVATHDRARDHRSRTSVPAVAYMMLAAIGREVAGSRHLLGNHVVLALDDGAYAVLAHLQRGSVSVRPGDRVRAGDTLGRCGNSGNSSEPHLHFQLMDHPRALVAAGLPFAFRGAAGVPANDQVLTNA